MNARHFTIISLWLTVASAYLLPKTTERPSPPPRKLVFPVDLQAQGHKLQPDLRIPNEKFCRDMQIQPYRHYMILPWWYVYCERLLEKEERDIRDNKALLPIYGRILKTVQQYKQKQKLLEAMKNL